MEINRLDRLPSDMLLNILSFCEDHIKFDVKRKVFFQREFQDKLKSRFLEIEYGERDCDDLGTADEELYKMRCIAMEYANYPAGSFTIYPNDDKFDVIGNFRQPIFLSHIKGYNKVEYSKHDIEREVEFKTTEELEDDVRERLVDGEDVLYITAGFIHDNLYKKQRDRLTIGDIEELQRNEMVNVLKAICNVEGVIEYIIQYDGYANTLGLFICENIGDDVWLVEQEN